MSEYKDRDIMALDEVGSYYCKHVSAMTGEKLHCKSDIAAELGYRDYVIDQLLDMLDDGSRQFAISEMLSDS
jgi:hypothetical protein